jgi:asparagine synthase (glutamine-hydrolysing)
MCGIAGIVGSADKQIITEMTEIQNHRGPDDFGTLVLDDHNVALGHRRLSIIDLSPTGHQPMANADKTLWITFNGEIYNYRDIRKDLIANGYRFRSESDTEVLLAAYESWGERCLDKLNGMFAFAIYDTKNKRLFAARDRLGVKPFYYYFKSRLFVFASEIKGILACPSVQKRPDYRALCTPARYQVPPYTGFENILKLPPAHYLIYENEKLTVSRYWDLAIHEHNCKDDHEVIAQLDELIRDAVRLQMIADVPVGVFLSGGLDSSLISALMRKNTDQDLHAFTIRFSETDQKHERMPDDSFYAKGVARRLGLKYHEFEIKPDVEELLPKLIWHLDEPLSDPAAINTYLMSRAAREAGIVVLLNGMGADEIFGGYRKHFACLQAERYQRIIPKTVRIILERAFESVPVATASRGFKTLRWAKRFFSFASLPMLERYLASDLALSKKQYESLMHCATYEETPYYATQKGFFEEHNGSFLTRMCVNDTKLFLPEHNLTYTDKATMAAGVESRPPLTDHRIAEYMFSLASHYRIRGTEQKFLLKKVAERYLQREIVYRAKASFGSPLRSWIRGALAPMVADVLSESSMRTRALYDSGTVSQLIERDRKGLEDNSLVIWTILSTELWFRMHFGSV